MAIEATLKRFYSDGTLKYAPKNSNWYISSSGDAALESYKTIENLGNTLLKVVEYSKIEERKKIRDVLERTSARKSEIATLKNIYPQENSQFKATLSDLTESSPEINETCSHANETEHILKMIRKVNKANSVFRK